MLMLTKINHGQAITIPLKKYLILAPLILLGCSTFGVNAFESSKFGLFVKNEINGDDHISGIGAEMWFTGKNSNFGAAILTSIGHAAVTDREKEQHDYLAWEAGLKLGYFSDIFAYAEVGFDIGELVLQDRNGDDEYRTYHGDEDNDFVATNRRRYDDANNIDGYVGVGAGIKFEHIQIEAFTRLRQIDGEYWKADNQAFTGAKLSVVF